MTQEEKELLLKDLGARSFYGVMCDRLGQSKKLLSVYPDKPYCIELDNGEYMPSKYKVEEIKSYLRPMKSMTKDEKEEYRKLCEKVVRKLYVADGKSWPSNKTSYRYFGTKTEYYDTYQSIDYLISRHFDYRGLIGKKLALKATKGMYNLK